MAMQNIIDDEIDDRDLPKQTAHFAKKKQIGKVCPPNNKSLKWYQKTNKRDSGIGIISARDMMGKSRRREKRKH